MLWVGTRKGLFKIDHEKIVEHRFAGQPVSAVLQQGRDVYCALNLGHFGAKLWRSRDGGEKWEEIACPAYPKEEGGATLNQIWVPEADEGALYAARAGRQPQHPGRASRGAMPGEARSALGAASLGDVPLDRRRRELAGPRRGQTFELRLCGRGASERCRHGVVRAGDQGRVALPGRRQARRHAHRGRRQVVQDAVQGPAAGARLRSRLSPRPRRRLERRAPGDRLDDRRLMGLGGRRRLVALRQRAFAADLLPALCLSSAISASISPAEGKLRFAWRYQ